METAIQERPEVKIPTPILDVIDKSLSSLLDKNITEIEVETNRCIEQGVKEDDKARAANAIVEEGNTAIKTVNEIRLQFTRPIDAAKKELMREVESLLYRLVASNNKLKQMALDRVDEIKRQEAEAKRKYEEEVREAERKAAAEEVRRSNISISKGGDGNVKPVAVEEVVQPVSTVGMRNTARTRTIPDHDKITEAINNGVRQIDGVRIYQVWAFDIENSKEVPADYRKRTMA